MMSLSAWLPGSMFLLGRSLSLVPCSFHGVFVRGTSVGGVSVGRPPKESKKRVVRILLESFLVFMNGFQSVRVQNLTISDQCWK